MQFCFGGTALFVLKTTVENDGSYSLVQVTFCWLNGFFLSKCRLNIHHDQFYRKSLTLCNAKQDLPYFNALLVFPSARVEAKWGQSGKARFITDKQIWRCIVETNPDRKLSSQEIERLSQAFRALATMDKEFPNGARPA